MSGSASGSLSPRQARAEPPTIFPVKASGLATHEPASLATRAAQVPAHTLVTRTGGSTKGAREPLSPPPLAPRAAAAARASLDALFPSPVLRPGEPQQPAPPVDLLADITPSQGAGVHLAAIGPEDMYLTVGGGPKPRLEHFRGAYAKHTPFAITTREDYFYGGFRLDSVNIAPVSLSGDLLSDAWLAVQLPALAVSPGSVSWVPYIGYALLKQVALTIGSTTVETLGRTWMHLLHVTATPDAHVPGLDAMVGARPLDASRSWLLHVPLPFFFCKRGFQKSRQPLPLVNMTNTTIQVEVQAEAWDNLLVANGDGPVPAPHPIEATLLYDYVLLSPEELASFKVKGQRLLVETVSRVEEPAYGITAGLTVPKRTVPVRLRNINFPVTALYWVVEREDAARQKALFRYERPRQALLYLTSTKRFEERPSRYFEEVQAYRFGNRPVANVGLYSFRLTAQGPPSGHVCLDAFNEPTLTVQMHEAQGSGLQVTVLARVVNWLRLDGGYATLERV